MNKVKWLVVLFLSFSSVVSAEDLALITIKSNDALSWKIYSPISQQSTALDSNFGKNGDHIFSGSLIQAGITHYGLITTSEDKKKVVWKIIDQSGNLVKQKTLGAKSNLFIIGADINNNGIIDPILVSNKGDKLRWKVFYDLFSATPGKTKTVIFGDKSQRNKAFFMNYDGSGDWLAVVKDGSGSNDIIQLKNVTTGASKKFKASKAAAALFHPLPVKRSNGSDLLAVASKYSSDTLVTFRNKSTTIFQYLFPGDGTLITGDFDSAAPGDEVAIHSDNILVVVNPENSSVSSLSDIPKNSIPVDTVNINSFVKSPGGGGGGSPSSCDQNLSPNDGNEGFLWKPVSESTGKLVVLLPSGFVPGDVKLIQSGSVVQTLIYSGIGNGNRAHYRDPSHSGSHYKPGVVVSGADNGITKCWQINNPDDRID